MANEKNIHNLGKPRAVYDEYPIEFCGVKHILRKFE